MLEDFLLLFFWGGKLQLEQNGNADSRNANFLVGNEGGEDCFKAQKERTSDSSVFAAEGTVISASAAPYCGVTISQKVVFTMFNIERKK